MGNKLRDIFNTGTNEGFMNKVNELREKCLELRMGIRLVRCNDKKSEPILYHAEPFCGFIGDCDYCAHVIQFPGFVTGSHCGKHNIGCGFGFTCKDNTSMENAGWDEFKRICKEG